MTVFALAVIAFLVEFFAGIGLETETWHQAIVPTFAFVWLLNLSDDLFFSLMEGNWSRPKA